MVSQKSREVKEKSNNELLLAEQVHRIRKERNELKLKVQQSANSETKDNNWSSLGSKAEGENLIAFTEAYLVKNNFS